MQAAFLFLTITSIIGIGFLLFARKPFDAMFFFLCFLIYRHLPSIFYLFGFDGGNPFFESVRQGNAMSELALAFAIFMIALYSGYTAFQKTKLGHSLFPDYTKPRSDFMMILGILTLTIGAAIVALIPIQKAGGNIFAAINMVRNENFYEGISFLKKFVHFATMLSCAYSIDLLVRKKRGIRLSATIFIFMGGLLAINLFFAFIMGGKAFIVFPLAFMAITYAVCCTQKPLRSFSFALVGLVALILALQFTRITLVKESAIKDPVNYIYNALHLDVMDSNLVFIDVLGNEYKEELGESFSNGVAGIIPRSLWPNKPSQITVGGAFKRTLLPDSVGGWPVFAYNQWLASFGWIGVVVGGFLSGWLLRVIQQRYSQHRHDALSVYISFIFILSVLSPTGIRNEVFVSYIFYVVPLAIFNVLTLKKWDSLLGIRKRA